MNISELQTVHSMRAKATEAANPQIFTPKGKTGVGGMKRKRPLDVGTGKENISQKVTSHDYGKWGRAENWAQMRLRRAWYGAEQDIQHLLPHLRKTGDE